MPIFLWSTVVNQLQKPVVDVGRRSGRGMETGATTVSSTTVIARVLPGASGELASRTTPREEGSDHFECEATGYAPAPRRGGMSHPQAEFGRPKSSQDLSDLSKARAH